MAHKKGVGSSRNGRDSESKRLGVKRADGQYVPVDAARQVPEEPAGADDHVDGGVGADRRVGRDARANTLILSGAHVSDFDFQIVEVAPGVFRVGAEDLSVSGATQAAREKRVERPA